MAGAIRAKFEWYEDEDLQRACGLGKGGQVQTAIDRASIGWCRMYTPYKTGRLANSPYAASQIGSGMLVYDTPYARKMYYNPQYGFNRSINPLAGGYWFERMKADHSRDILLEAKNAVDK